MIFNIGKRVIIHCIEVFVLAILIVAALYVSIGRILIGTADNYRQEVESFLEARLHAPVRIRALDGNWSYLDPALTVYELSIGAPENPALTFSSVSLKLNALASLIEWNPVLSELEIDGLRLTLVQDEAGGWRVAELPVQRIRRIDLELLMDSLPHLELIGLQDIKVNLLAQQSRYRIGTETEEPFELVSEQGTKTLSLPLTVERINKETGDVTADAMRLIGRYRGDARERGEFSTELYFQLPSVELTDFVPPVALDAYRVSQMRVRGQFWIGYANGRFTLTGMPAISDVEVEFEERTLEVMDDLSAEFRFTGTGLDDYYLQLARLSARLGANEVLVEDASVALSGNGQLVAGIPELDLGVTANVLMNLGRRLNLINARELRLLETTNPKGLLQQVLVSAGRGDQGQEFELAARVSNASVNAYRGSPAIDRLDGFVSIGPQAGYLDIHNESTTLEFSGMFDHPWSFDAIRGRVNYNRERGYFQLSSGLIELIDGELLARGRIQLNLRHNRMMQTWGLSVGIRNGRLSDGPRYLPSIMPDGLRDWLTNSVVGGTVVEAGAVFHGSLNKDARKIEKVHDIYIKLEDAAVDYDPRWPRLENLAGVVHVAPDRVHSEGATGSIYQSRLTNGAVDITLEPEDEGDIVNVNADVEGPVADGIRLFNESPLGDLTGNITQDWTATGPMAGAIALKIPIGDRAGEAIRSDVSVSLKDTDLYMPRYDLEVAALDGVFDYKDGRGLVSEDLRASIFGEPVSGSISSLMEDDGGEFIIDIAGNVEMADLHAWSKQVLLSRASGVVQYDAEVHVPFGRRSHEHSYIEARSGLQGVAIDMPVPMGKRAPEETPMVYRQYFLESGHQVNFDLSGRVKGRLKMVGDEVQGGHIRFGAKPLGAVTFDRLKFSGALDYVNYDEWQAFTEYLDNESEGSMKSEFADRLDSIDVNIERLDAFGMELEDIHTVITRGEAQWNVQLASDKLGGIVNVPDDETAAINVNLDFLRFEEDPESADDPLEDVAVTDFVPVNFSMGTLTVGNEDYGSWAFRLQPEANGAVLEDLRAEVKGLRIIEPSRVYWETGKEPKSRFEGTVVAADVGSALKQWGLAPSIEGEDFRFEADFEWPGSPAMISLESIMGEIALTEGKGRFVQVDNTGALNLLGIFDFASLARRFRFDFSDIVNEGYSFQGIEGMTQFNKGVVNIVEPIKIKGAGSTVKLGGTMNLDTGNLDNEMVVTLPVSKNWPWYAGYSAIAAGPLIGAGVILTQKIFENQIDRISSLKYAVTGTIDKPEIELVSVFDDKMREVPLEEFEEGKVNPREPESSESEEKPES